MSYNWRTDAIEKLKDYEINKVGICNLTEQIQQLMENYTAIRSATTDGTPVQGGTSNKREEMLINNISLRCELEKKLDETKLSVEVVERSLEVLTETERKILHRFFIHRTKGYVERLCDELYVSKTELYRQKDEALKRFTMACYGVVNL